jgi:DNA processing protein
MEPGMRHYLDRDQLAEPTFGRLAGTALAGLWVAGALDGLAGPVVAVVGTRAPSESGRLFAHRLGAALGAAGVCVVSGLALGIDAAAHAGALAAGAPTIGVLGGGHDHFFPPRNAELARRMIAGGGAVVSPYPPGHPAFPSQFLARNGIVAALADGVVVVEAAARSGALNTASWAADRGIPVMAVPGDVDRPKVAGCLALIRDGATLVRDAHDVLAQIGRSAPVQCRLPLTATPPSRDRDDTDPVAARILAAIAHGPADVDAIVAGGGTQPALTLARLGELSAAGKVWIDRDGRFRRSPA